MHVYIGPPYAIRLLGQYFCMFSSRVSLNGKSRTFLEFYTAKDETDIYSTRNKRIRELRYELRERGIAVEMIVRHFY